MPFCEPNSTPATQGTGQRQETQRKRLRERCGRPARDSSPLGEAIGTARVRYRWGSFLEPRSGSSRARLGATALAAATNTVRHKLGPQTEGDEPGTKMAALPLARARRRAGTMKLAHASTDPMLLGLRRPPFSFLVPSNSLASPLKCSIVL